MTQSTISRAILPLKNSVLFPKLHLPYIVGREASLKAVDSTMNTEDRRIVILAQKDHNVETPDTNDLYQIGTEGVIQSLNYEGDQIHLTVQGLSRVKLKKLSRTNSFLKGQFERLPNPTDSGPRVEALHRMMLENLEVIQELKIVDAAGKVLQVLNQLEDPIEQVYLVTFLLNINSDQAQRILECATRAEALEIVNEYLQYEIEILSMGRKIASDVASKMTKDQREYYLRQQLKAIQTELGEDDPDQAELRDIRRKIEEKNLPESVAKEALKELNRLERLPAAAPDYQMSRTYLDLICELPWNVETEDIIDLDHARQILDQDHHALDEIKDRIIEYLAVLKLNPKSQAPIICFVGPPGVGKTSLGESIAKALGRKFDRMSLGGLHDEAELRGHRRTYIGAMPGRIIQSVRRAGSMNPLIMLDELDKIGRDFRGDPAAALMEVLDPAQNKAFKDNYLDLPFDLSRVFFITTANILDTIPSPLIDRMEVLHLSGYTDPEKLQIVKKYILPRQLSETGLNPEKLNISDDVIMEIIHKYTREGGVRDLERMINRIIRKSAIRFVKNKKLRIEIKKSELTKLLGPERFFMEKARQELTPGVAAGMAYTQSGGEVLYIEAAYTPNRGELKLTGSLGKVMRESADAALTYIWSKSEELGIAKDCLKKRGIHVHVPSGASPKDGPSAGITIATAITSLTTGAAVDPHVTMTGEITLTGLVLPIGGLKEKCLAAQRSGMHRIIIPSENAKDLRDVPDEIQDELEIILASHIDDVLRVAIPDLSKRLVAKVS